MPRSALDARSFPPAPRPPRTRPYRGGRGSRRPLARPRRSENPLPPSRPERVSRLRGRAPPERSRRRSSGPRHEGARMSDPDRVLIFDTTLRDGEQAAGVAFSARDKLEIATALAAAGVDVVEAGFPVSSRGELEAVRGVARALRDTRVC